MIQILKPGIKWGTGLEIDKYVFSNLPYFLEGDHISSNRKLHVYHFTVSGVCTYIHTRTHTHTKLFSYHN